MLIIDQSDSSVLYSRNSDVALPIASITKLMTALVVLDAQQPLDEPIRITEADRDLPVPSDRPAGKEVSPVSRRDKAGNTAQAARGKATRGGWGGCRGAT